MCFSYFFLRLFREWSLSWCFIGDDKWLEVELMEIGGGVMFVMCETQHF